MPDERSVPVSFYTDGVTRHQALRRLLATTEQPVRVWSPGLWIARLTASLSLLRALWRERRA